MITRTIGRICLALAALAVNGVLLSGCSAETAGDSTSTGSATVISGSVSIDGSSTVLPVSTVVSNSFKKAHPGVTVTVQASGTGGGFQKFCAGGIDIVGASRPINAEEERACHVDPANSNYVQEVGYVPLPTATLLATGRRLDSGTTGSIFGGRGSVLGLTAASFEDEDRIKSALVR